jgi:hypothetical protein
MNDELELLRRFRAHDGVVDAASAHAARTRLLAHIAHPDAAARAPRRGRRWAGQLRGPRLGWGVIATGLAVAVIIAVGAVFLTAHRQPVPHHPVPVSHSHHHHHAVLHNLAPGHPPKLPGAFYCNADLARPGAVPGLGGARTGVIAVHQARIRGVNVLPFTITARGLPPSGRSSRYAVWLFQTTGQGANALPVAGAKPLLIAVISPGVGPDGKLAVEGVLPRGVNGDYMLRMTLQPHSSLTKPGRTVLQGQTQF